MPTELALLTRRPVTGHVIAAEGGALFPGGALLEHQASGVLQYVDAHGRPVASAFVSRAIADRSHADLLVQGGTGDQAWWTELTIPYGDATDGVRLARAIAASCGGRIAERT